MVVLELDDNPLPVKAVLERTPDDLPATQRLVLGLLAQRSNRTPDFDVVSRLHSGTPQAIAASTFATSSVKEPENGGSPTPNF